MNKQSKANLIDFHCHLDLYPDHAAAVSQREEERVFTLAVTTTPKAFPRNKELSDQTQFVRAALGLHPQLVANRAHEISIWLEYLSSTRYIGEVGLDAGPRFYRSFDDQKLIFEKILTACADARGKILSVHSVRAGRVVLDMIEARLPANQGRVVLHWFSGSKSDARRAVELGCYFSVNSKMLENERSRKLINSLPIDRLLTETDGPFTDTLASQSKPADMKLTRNSLAALLGVNQYALAEKLSGNLRDLLT